jgi:transketolase C-terminal domain/subunit
LRNDVCYHAVPVTVVAVGGGFSYGPLGMSHFATEDLAVMRAMPGMAVVVTLEEHSIVGGLGSAIAEALLEGGVRPRHFRRLGLGDCFPETVGDQAYLRQLHGLDRHSIAATIREMLES